MPKATIISRGMTIKKTAGIATDVFFIGLYLILVPGLDLDVIH